MKILKLLTLIILLTLSSKANANYRSNCASHKLGWNFYCDKEIARKEQKQENKEPLSLAEIATAKTKAIQKRHQELLDIATHFPTEENVINYIKFNQEITGKGAYFAEVAQRAIWQTPEINYGLKRPVNAIGKKVWIEQRNQDRIQAARELNQRYGIFYFYRSDCPYCRVYSPVLKKFAEEFGIQVMAVTMNGQTLPSWPDSHIDQGQSAKMNITAVPATILFDKNTSQTTPLGFGALSREELLEQIHLITQIQVGDYL